MQLPYRYRLGGEGGAKPECSQAQAQSRPPLASARAVDGPENYGAVKPVKCSWEYRGSIRELFVEAGVAGGRQFFALVIIIIQVLGSHSHENLMACDPTKCGFYTAVFCEYTKAYVRCFPLVALAVSMMVATRMILNHRIYYQLLKHNLLISFEPLLPSQDALFRILLWCFVNALPHFIMNIWLAHSEVFHLVKLGELASSAEKLMAANVLHDARQVAVFYLVPAVVFLLFLFTSYDTEAFLLPLSKYFEDDFEASRSALKEVRFVKEPDAADHVTKGLGFQGKGGEACTAADVFEELAEVAATDAPIAMARRKNQQHREVFGRVQMAAIARMRVTWTMWPARLLLDPRLEDEDSANFRRAWKFYLGLCVVFLCFIKTCLSHQILKDLYDVYKGQKPDVAGLIVEGCHMALVMTLGFLLFSQTIITSKNSSAASSTSDNDRS